MKNYFGNEIEEILATDISNGKVVLLQEDVFIEKIENHFPIYFGRIDWDKRGYQQHINLYKSDIEEKVEQMLDFLDEVEKGVSAYC